MLCDKKRWIVLTIPIFFFVLVLWKAYRGLIYIFICPSPTSIQAPSMSSRISDDSPSIWFSHLSHWAFVWRAAWEEHVCPTILLLQLVFCKYILRPPTLPRTGTEDECNIIEEDGPLWETVMEGWVAHSNWFSQSHCLGFTGTFSLSTRTDRWPNIQSQEFCWLLLCGTLQ